MIIMKNIWQKTGSYIYRIYCEFKMSFNVDVLVKQF